MKKMIPTLMLSLAALCCAMAAEAQPKLMLKDLYKTAYTPEKLESIRSLKLLYFVSGTKMSDAVLLIRAQVGGKIRLDILQDDKHYVACRNGENFWGYSPEGGAGELTKQEMSEMAADIEFLPVPFLGLNLYKPLTLLKDNTDTTRIKYTTEPVDGTPDKVTISVNAKTNLLGRITTDTKEGKYLTSFREYTNYDGVKFATYVQCSSPEGIVVLKLRNVEWNPSLDQNIFVMSDKVNDAAVKMLKQNFADLNAFIKTQGVPVRATARVSKKSASELKKEIASLEIQIKEKEKRLKLLEEVMRADFGDARSTAKEAATPRYRYRRTWYYGGWSGRYTTRYNRDQKRLAKRIRKEAQEAAEEYDKVGEELTKLRIRRSDAQIELEKLTKAGAEDNGVPQRINKKGAER